MKRRVEASVKTIVMVRKEHDGGLLAVFPFERDHDGYVGMYSPRDGHTSGQMAYVRRKTKPVTRKETAAMIRLLRRLGYDPDVRERHHERRNP